MINNLVIIIIWIIAIVDQPADQWNWISDQSGQATIFTLPAEWGTIGLLAHDYLSGKLFYDARVGDMIIYNGQIYQVAETRSIGEDYSRPQAFNEIYLIPNRLILQTCLDDGFWFVIAYQTGDYLQGYNGLLALARISDQPQPIKQYLPMISKTINQPIHRSRVLYYAF